MNRITFKAAKREARRRWGERSFVKVEIAEGTLFFSVGFRTIKDDPDPSCEIPLGTGASFDEAFRSASSIENAIR